MGGGAMQKEVVPVSVPQRREDQIIAEDEEYTNVKLEKIPTKSCLFKRRYRYRSKRLINDGGGALVLMSEEKSSSLGITPLATILAMPMLQTNRNGLLPPLQRHCPKPWIKPT